MKRKTNPRKPAAAEPPSLMNLSSIDELTQMCSVEVQCPVPLRRADGRMVLGNVPVRSLRPEEALNLELMLREVMPPLKPKVNPEDPEVLDVGNLDWIKRKTRREHEVRCLTVWLCCGLFKALRASAQVGGATNQIVDLVCEKIPDDDVLRKIEQAIVGLGLKLQDRVNFTSGAFLPG